MAGSAQDTLSLNRYLYAEANPATLIDPDGHIAMSGAEADTSGTWNLATARAVQEIVAKHALQRAAQAKPAAKKDSGFNPIGFLGSAWNATGGQVVGFGQGVVGAAADTAHGLWETGWWAYHSSAAYVFDRRTFNAQWDTNRAVGSYVLNHPGEAAGALWSGISTPIAQALQHGDVGQAAGRGAFDLASVVLPLTKAAKVQYASRLADIGASAAAEEAIPVGSFSLLDTSTFPVQGFAPSGSLRIIADGEYVAARAAANAADKIVRRDAAAAGFDPVGYQVHEIQPVKFGGSPTSLANKVLLPTQMHLEVTNWWNALLRYMEAGGIRTAP